MGQERFDGLEIEINKARFAGSFDLDPADAKEISLDRVAFFIVAVRNEGANIKTTKTADIQRIDVLQVEDARLATGDIRDAAIKWLAGHHDQQSLFDERLGLAPKDGPEYDVPAPDDVEVGSETATVNGNGEPLDASPEGPRSVKFTLDDAEGFSAPSADAISDSEQIGSVYGNGRKDKTLVRFLQQPS